MILGNKWGWASHNSTFSSVFCSPSFNLHSGAFLSRLKVLLEDGSGGNLRESSISINFIQLAGTGGGWGVSNTIEHVVPNATDVCIYN